MKVGIEQRLMWLVRIDPATECWIWTGRMDDGVPYAWVPALDKNVSVRRSLFEIHNGRSVGKKCVTATCGDPKCVAPHHATTRTRAQMLRAVSGSTRHCLGGIWRARITANARSRARINMAIARTIRADHQAGESQETIAAKHSISQSMVSKIIRNQSWRDPSSGLAALVQQHVQAAA